MNDIHLFGFNYELNSASASASVRYLYCWIKKNGTKKIVESGGELLGASPNSIFTIESGTWRLLAGEGKVIGIVGAGGGVLLARHPKTSHAPFNQYEVLSHSIYYEFPMDSMHLVMPDKELFKGLLEFMAWSARNISKKWLAQCMGDSYTEVKSALEWMNDLPESIRSKFTVITFITDTTGVSRSHTLSIIKSLRQGGYVEMDGGYLISLTRKLPDGY